MIMIATLVIGLLLLLLSAHIIIENSIVLAKKLGISSFIIGVTLVTFGTSIPEFFLHIMATLHNHHELALGNVVGSNIANILLIIGIALCFSAIKMQKKFILMELPFAIIPTVSLLLLGFIFGTVSQLFGLFFFVLLIAYLATSYKMGRQEHVHAQHTHWFIAFILCVISFLGIQLGSLLIIESSLHLISVFNILPFDFAAIVLSIGTSIPELFIILLAVIHKRHEVAVGTIVGTNIFNILGIVGFGAFFAPLLIDMQFLIHMIILMCVTSFFYVLILLSNYHLKKWHGYLLILLYVCYLLYIII
ncbi:MAG: calcium/sodium antiporter [Candidatus Woesearchaeota archaeon]